MYVLNCLSHLFVLCKLLLVILIGGQTYHFYWLLSSAMAAQTADTLIYLLVLLFLLDIVRYCWNLLMGDIPYTCSELPDRPIVVEPLIVDRWSVHRNHSHIIITIGRSCIW